MTVYGLLQILLFALLMTASARPLGGYLERVFAGKRTIPSSLLGSIESALYRLAGVDRTAEQTWFAYTGALLTFNLVGFLLLYALQRFQDLLPLNPQHLGPVASDLALNTSVSFGTNTSWQSYAGESTLGALTQMAGITVQSFLSAATGIAVAIALMRGFARRRSGTIGNFWVDLTRAILYVLLPITILSSLFFVWQGVPQTLADYVDVTTLEGTRQVIARGPVASQLAIKMLSSDGGGFFNANSAHPFENPTPLSNLGEMMLIFVIGVALTNTFGRMVGDERQGWALLATMAVLFLAGVIMIYTAEAQSNPFFTAFGIDQTPDIGRASGNMEGKEVRFGIAGSSLFAAVTTDSSSGAVNSMHDSFMPLGGAVLMMNMMLDEVIIGGVGSGLYGILLFCIVTVFVAGLMIGRTPEYVGKKIEATEVKMTILALLCVPAAILGLTAVAAVIEPGLAERANAGPHGFSEILYAYASAAATNGSPFAGLNANTAFYNLTLSLAMFIGRFFVIIPVLAIAGALAAKRIVPRSAGTLPTGSGLFVGFLSAVILIVGGLTFFPAIVLGPVAEHFAMQAGTAF
jgi:potassium-transporting ATPase potassium-binding subunit